MAGHGRYPRARLDAMPLAVAARHVQSRIACKGSVRVYVVPTSGIVCRVAGDLREPDPARFRYVGLFTAASTAGQIGSALVPFVPGRKHCARCTHDLPLTHFNVGANGHPRSQCKQCCAAKCALRRKLRPARKRQGDPLNSVLRDMPGFGSSLLGIAGVACAT